MNEAGREYTPVARAAATGRTRARVLLAARAAFFDRPYDAVTLAEVATVAGVTLQTVLNHFTSKENLFLAVIEDLRPELMRLRGQPEPGDVESAVAGLVRQYERFGDGNVRFVALEEREGPVAALLPEGRAHHRRWLEEVFGPLLPADPGRRRDAVDALYVTTDVGTWKLLRRDLKRSRVATTRVMRGLVDAVLAEHGGGTEKDDALEDAG